MPVTTQAERPIISLITVVTPNCGTDSVFATLESFLPQKGRTPFEVFVVDHCKSQSRQAHYERNFPWVRVIWAEVGETIPNQRRRALKLARGEFVAFFDDHVFFYPDYLQGIQRCIDRGSEVFGGVVENANPESLSSWAQYFSLYSKFLPVASPGETEDLPGSNFVIKASLLGNWDDDRDHDHEFGLETILFAKLKKQRTRLELVHDFRIRHRHCGNISSAWTSFVFPYGIWFASCRGFGTARRVAYALASPLTAMVLYLRVLAAVWRHPYYLRKFVLVTPLLLATFAVRVGGETIGYLTGTRWLRRRSRGRERGISCAG